VFKIYHGPNAQGAFANEVRVLRHLEARGCGFVPRLLEADEKKLRIITTNCGSRVEHLDEKRLKELFAELEKFGVRHDDADMRNVTYRQSDGRFCLIDFEFATILPGQAMTMKPQMNHQAAKKNQKKKIPALKWSGWTDRGKVRKNNEDAFLGLQFDAREIFRLGKFGEASLEK
jgi:PPM family protein phosphatase